MFSNNNRPLAAHMEYSTNSADTNNHNEIKISLALGMHDLSGEPTFVPLTTDVKHCNVQYIHGVL